MEITKGDVVGGILAAINVARDAGDAGAMIRGCVELARLLGLYDQPPGARVMPSDGAALFAEMAAMPDDRLASIAAGQSRATHQE